VKAIMSGLTIYDCFYNYIIRHRYNICTQKETPVLVSVTHTHTGVWVFFACTITIAPKALLQKFCLSFSTKSQNIHKFGTAISLKEHWTSAASCMSSNFRQLKFEKKSMKSPQMP